LAYGPDPMKKGERGALVKFGKREHLLQLRDKGLLYMNNLPYFWEIEDKECRSDPFDGVDIVARGHKAELFLPNGSKVPIEFTDWVLRGHPLEPEKINIFCMYALRPSAGTFPVDERNLQFGDHALVVPNPQHFIDRIDSHLKSHGINGEAGLVEYVDDEYTGEVGPFRKLDRFAYQSEWRLVCYGGPGDVRKIWIGSIRDISTIMLTNEINERLTISC